MSYKILNMLILAVTLNGCATISSRTPIGNSDLPIMPMAGKKVGDEMAKLCDDIKCYHLNNWLNDLYIFRKKYKIYRK